jgi:hypothetical protein
MNSGSFVLGEAALIVPDITLFESRSLLISFFTAIAFKYYKSIWFADFQEFCKIFAVRSKMRPYR